MSFYCCVSQLNNDRFTFRTKQSNQRCSTDRSCITRIETDREGNKEENFTLNARVRSCGEVFLGLTPSSAAVEVGQCVSLYLLEFQEVQEEHQAQGGVSVFFPYGFSLIEEKQMMSGVGFHSSWLVTQLSALFWGSCLKHEESWRIVNKNGILDLNYLSDQSEI